jgi:hypothetical protein
MSRLDRNIQDVYRRVLPYLFIFKGGKNPARTSGQSWWRRDPVANKECPFKLVNSESASIVIDISSLHGGVYYLILDDEKNTTIKIVKL